MTVTNFKLAGRQFVVIPASDFRRLQSKAAQLDGLTATDAADAAKGAQSRGAHYRAGKSKAIPLAQLKSELGIGG